MARSNVANHRAMPEPAIMPQGIHFALCTPEAPTGVLGEDGHPSRDDSAGSFLPPVPLPRRMWASSAITFIAPIAIGAVIERTSRVASINEKEGGSGKLAFVNVEHETRANGTLSVREVQTLVYREAAAQDAPLSPPEPNEGTFDADEWDVVRSLTPDPRLLFRYSALTFNTHRIHYDAPYARQVERYRGLVVHGPLTASLMLQLAARELGENRLRRFEFRGVSPAIAGEKLHIALRKSDDGYELGAFAGDRRQVTKAQARV
ncbi:MAG: MaoC family dehydratase N-terminal domain-containing protein, partial [Pseudomonadota bacterium]